MFDNEINVAVHASHAAYTGMMFKDALKTGTYDLQNARDAYRVACGPHGMHKDLVHRYIKVDWFSAHQWPYLLMPTGVTSCTKGR